MQSIIRMFRTRHARLAALTLVTASVTTTATARIATALPRTGAAIRTTTSGPSWWRVQTDTALTWSGTIPAGRRLFLKNVNGAITVRRSSTDRVELHAVRSWRRGDPTAVRVTRQEVGSGDVLVCALWAPDATCDIQGIHNNKTWKLGITNDVSVQFIVVVPDQVQVDAETVNGALEIVDIGGAIHAKTVNGAITAYSTGGPVEAETVNGSIRAAMRSAGQATDLALETVNGSIALELPLTFAATVDLSTVNGRIATAIPVSVTGTPSSRKLQGTIGTAPGTTPSVRLRMKAVNGSISLRKG